MKLEHKGRTFENRTKLRLQRRSARKTRAESAQLCLRLFVASPMLRLRRRVPATVRHHVCQGPGDPRAGGSTGGPTVLRTCVTSLSHWARCSPTPSRPGEHPATCTRLPREARAARTHRAHRSRSRLEAAPPVPTGGGRLRASVDGVTATRQVCVHARRSVLGWCGPVRRAVLFAARVGAGTVEPAIFFSTAARHSVRHCRALRQCALRRPFRPTLPGRASKRMFFHLGDAAVVVVVEGAKRGRANFGQPWGGYGV
jgi:hypothetical protein